MKKPEMYIEMSLIFDNDYNVYKISEFLGIEPTDAKCKNETRINPISKDHNPGYWTLQSNIFFDFDIKQVVEDIVNKINDKIDSIVEICKNNQGEVKFDLVAYFYPNETPAIYFEKEFLELVHKLNAEIDMDFYVYD